MASEMTMTKARAVALTVLAANAADRQMPKSRDVPVAGQEKELLLMVVYRSCESVRTSNITILADIDKPIE